MMKVSGLVAIVALLGVIFAGSGFAMAAGQPQGRMNGDCTQSFRSLDFGGDGVLTYSEWEAGHYGLGAMKGIGPAPSGNATDFYSMDANHDNAVTPREYCAFKMDR